MKVCSQSNLRYSKETEYYFLNLNCKMVNYCIRDALGNLFLSQYMSYDLQILSYICFLNIL